MEYNNDFKYDLKLGNKSENLLAEILKLKGDTIEVKTDKDAIKNKSTGNIRILSFRKSKYFWKSSLVLFVFFKITSLYLEYSRNKNSGVKRLKVFEWKSFEVKPCFMSAANKILASTISLISSHFTQGLLCTFHILIYLVPPHIYLRLQL